jgi:hypothetical protein
VDESRFDESIKLFASSAGRRDALRSLGLVGMAALTALGLSDAAAQNNNHGTKKKKKKAGGKPERMVGGPLEIPSAASTLSAPIWVRG